MSKLEDLLAAADGKKRLDSLMKYAQSLGANVELAKNTNGAFIEEKLVLMIYDSLHSRQQVRSQNRNFALWALVFVAVGAGLLSQLPGLMTRLYEEEASVDMKGGRIVQGVDKDGKPLMEDGEPVLYKVLDGSYKEYDESGRIRYEYVYREGQLMSRKEFNQKGELVDEEFYPEEAP